MRYKNMFQLSPKGFTNILRTGKFDAALLLCTINWDRKTVTAETGGFNLLCFTGQALPASLALTEPQLVFLTDVKTSVII